MNNPKLIRQTEQDIYEILEDAHKNGIPYNRLAWICHELEGKMLLKVEIEKHGTK